MADILHRWPRHGTGRVIYSAANAHTAARKRITVSFPDPFVPPAGWVTQRSMAGGLLRERYGAGYVSIGITFDHGSILAGWQTGRPEPSTVPEPATEFVDHLLGRARLGDYLLDLRGRTPERVRHWLDGPGKPRIYSGSYYDAAQDSKFFMGLDGWGRGFDALLHLDTTTAARLP
ncbi:MAG: hypothetical protein GEV11_15570 [Streptosporangiales bacterium]|nr:hypothetical protein [Streptosporangiales bacterium]